MSVLLLLMYDLVVHWLLMQGTGLVSACSSLEFSSAFHFSFQSSAGWLFGPKIKLRRFATVIFVNIATNTDFKKPHMLAM
jgi:hypothetical protein